MRLWHHDILPFLPRSQLLAQWRELNSIFAKQDQHVLINYVYDYPKDDLLIYTNFVLHEMRARQFTIRAFEKMERYFADISVKDMYSPFSQHHNDDYLLICYFNLYEKFMRGQKDYTAEQFEALQQFVQPHLLYTLKQSHVK